MITYNQENLHQCVRNLFEKARHELKTRDFANAYKGYIEKDLPFSLPIVFRWEACEEPFSATGLKVWRIEGSMIIVELAVYDSFSGYKATATVGRIEHPEEIFTWLDNPESLALCIEWSDYLLKDLD